MTPLSATLVSAVRSLRSRSFLAVLVELHTSLDDVEFRKAPVATIAIATRMSERYVYEALDELQRLGYIEAGERIGNARSYRIAATLNQSSLVA